MNLDWNDLRYLLAVHQNGSLARAAAALHVTKTTVSRRLSALEEALGAPVVERRPAGLVLTEAGRAAVEAAEGMAEQLGSLEQRVASATGQSAAGTVRLTAPQWLAERLLIPELPSLAARYPGLDVQLVGTNRLLNLAQREADLAIRNVRPEHRSLATRKIGEVGGCVYASKHYLERRGVPADPEAVRSHDVLVYAGLGGMPGFEWLRDPERSGRVAFQANGPESLVAAATAGLGLCAVPCLLGDAEPSLVRVTTLGLSRCDLLLVSHEDTRRLPRTRVVSDFVVDLVRSRRATIEG